MVETVYQLVALPFEADAARALWIGLNELAEAFDCLRANLAPGGLLVFDVDTLAAYCEIPDVVVEDVVFDVFTHEGNGLWRWPLSRQRHR